jgi:hypothetical protein
MKLTKFSEKRIYLSAEKWSVDQDFYIPIFNYLVYGFSPGGFFTSVLANDFLGAMPRCHSANTIAALKAVAGWIRDSLPAVAYGNYEHVDNWLSMSDLSRRQHLEAAGLIFTEKEEVTKYLSDVEL